MLSVLSVFTAVKALPWKLIGWATLAFAVIAMLAALRLEQAQNGKLKAQLHESVAAREADRATYTKAQADAAALNKAQVAATVAKQEKINHDTVSTLSARLELIRSELRKASAAPQGSASGSGSGQASPTASGTACPACLLITPEERLRGAEDEERHQELIDWVLKQSAIDPNK